MTLVRWNPFREFDDIFRTFGAVGEPVSESAWLPPVDISEDENAFFIHLDLPAIARDQVEVSVNDGVLSVSGERRIERSEGTRNHRTERRFGKFSRTFRLPENADEQAITARSEDGVLTIRIGKSQKAEPRRIEVAVH